MSFEIRVFFSIFTFHLELQKVYLDRERTGKNILRYDFRAPLFCLPSHKSVTVTPRLSVRTDASRDNRIFSV